MEGARLCCPFCCCWMPEARLDGHVEPCSRRHAVLQTALGYALCARDPTHVVLPTDATTHAARCGTACPAAVLASSGPASAADTLPCRCCGAAVPLAARRCAWCRVLRPWAFVPRTPSTAPPAVRSDEKLARAVALVRDAVCECPDDFPALHLALTDPVRVMQSAKVHDDDDDGEEDGEEDVPCKEQAEKRRRDALDDPQRAPWLLEVIHRADMRNVRAREEEEQRETGMNDM